MQILHPFTGSVRRYEAEISHPDRYRPDHCPQCQARQPLIGHGFYHRTLVHGDFEGSIRVRRYRCRSCRRTVSLLPEFALPYLRFSVAVIALFLVARLLEGRTLIAAAVAASPSPMPYQRGQFWVRRFRRQAEALGAALAAKDHSQGGGRFRHPGFAHVAVPRLDRRSSVPVLRTAATPVGVGPLFSLHMVVPPRCPRLARPRNRKHIAFV